MSAPISYNVKDAAKAIGISPDDLRELIAADEIAAFGITSRFKRHILAEEVERLIRRDPAQVLQRIRERQQRAEVEEAPAKCGVYMLVSAGSVVYVGRSVNMLARVQQHRFARREFDEVRAIPCDAGMSVWLERELIRTLQPAQNVVRYSRQAEIAGRKLRRAGLQ